MLRSSLPALASWLLILGCSSPGTESTPTDIDPTENTSPIVRSVAADELINNLIGEWVGEPGEDSTVFHEQWERRDKRNLDGLGYVMLGKDTVSIEHLNIHITDTGTFYAAEIPSQNEGKPVFFKLTSSTDSLVFENPQHDFPQRIVYLPMDPQGWIAHVSGHQNGAWRTMHFHLMPREKNSPGN